MGLAVAGGCGSSTSGVGTVDASIGHHLLRGVAQIRATHDRKKLHAELTRVLASLHRDRGSTPAARRARELAIRGFESTLRGVRSQLDFSENDSGEVAAATRDAKRADRFMTRAMLSCQRAGVELVGADRKSELDKLFAGHDDKLHTTIKLIDPGRGARQLRAAGRALGIQLGKLNGY